MSSGVHQDPIPKTACFTAGVAFWPCSEMRGREPYGFEATDCTWLRHASNECVTVHQQCKSNADILEHTVFMFLFNDIPLGTSLQSSVTHSAPHSPCVLGTFTSLWAFLYLAGSAPVSFSAYGLKIYMYTYIYFRRLNDIMKPKMPSLHEMLNRH